VSSWLLYGLQESVLEIVELKQLVRIRGNCQGLLGAICVTHSEDLCKLVLQNSFLLLVYVLDVIGDELAGPPRVKKGDYLL
jgi:hypothetical protein